MDNHAYGKAKDYTNDVIRIAFDIMNGLSSYVKIRIGQDEMISISLNKYEASDILLLMYTRCGVCMSRDIADVEILTETGRNNLTVNISMFMRDILMPLPEN